MRPLLLAFLLAVAPAAAGAQSFCPVPDDWQLASASLPETAARLAAGGPIRIVAFGAGSTAGAAAGDPRLTYPARLQARLGTMLRPVRLEVANRGFGRQDLARMLDRLDREVLVLHPSLVIWEVGTNDAAEGRDVDDFAQDLDDGIDRLHAARIDVILMDMQYAPSTASIIDFDPYLGALQRVAEIDEVPVFPRYQIMRNWSDEGVFDYDSLSPRQRQATARRVYDCLAAGLAEAIAKALGK